MYHSSSFSQFDIYKHSYEGHYFILSKLFLRKDYAIQRSWLSNHSTAKQSKNYYQKPSLLPLRPHLKLLHSHANFEVSATTIFFLIRQQIYSLCALALVLLPQRTAEYFPLFRRRGQLVTQLPHFTPCVIPTINSNCNLSTLLREIALCFAIRETPFQIPAFYRF